MTGPCIIFHFYPNNQHPTIMIAINIPTPISRTSDTMVDRLTRNLVSESPDPVILDISIFPIARRAMFIDDMDINSENTAMKLPNICGLSLNRKCTTDPMKDSITKSSITILTVASTIASILMKLLLIMVTPCS